METDQIKKPLRILQLEDNPLDQQLVEAHFRASGLVGEFVHVQAREQFEATLAQAQFDVIVSDFTLPAYDGMTALLAARRLQPDTPFIFVSGTIGEEQAVEGLRRGATDFVLKGHLARLGPVVRRALEEVREREERQRAEAQVRIQARALEAAANGIIITDRTGTILSANTAFCRMTGYSLEALLGQNPRLLQSGKHDAGFYRALWETILAGRVWQGEITNRRSDGTLYAEDMTITPVQARDGAITHFIAVKQDTTQRKLLEAQLRQTQRMDAIGQLAGGVAHDFNNVLAIICGNVELLLLDAGGFSPEVRQGLDQIAATAKRAANLSRQLLAFGRKQNLRMESLDLNAVVGELTRMLTRIIGEEIHLECLPGTDLPAVQADAGMMEQVLLNLSLNARDAMPSGGRLCIATQKVILYVTDAWSHPDARAGEFVCLTVRTLAAASHPNICPGFLNRSLRPRNPTKAPVWVWPRFTAF